MGARIHLFQQLVKTENSVARALEETEEYEDKYLSNLLSPYLSKLSVCPFEIETF